MPLTKEDILLICGRYEEERPKFETLASSVHKVLASIVKTRTPKYIVAHRAKGRDSLYRKLWKLRDDYSVSQFDSLSPPMKDLAAARVLLYLPDDIDPVVEAIECHFRECGHDCVVTNKRSVDKYSAVHLQMTCKGSALDAAGLQPTVVFEVQVCTLSAHVWNELEHDIIYKQETGKPDAAQSELLVSLHGALDLAAKTANRLMRHTSLLMSQNTARILDADELQHGLRNRKGRPLNGDFKALFELLSALIDPLTNATLHQSLESGRTEKQALELLSTHDPDGSHGDAGCILVQLLPNLTLEGIEAFVASHPAAPPLLRFVRRKAADILAGEKRS